MHSAKQLLNPASLMLGFWATLYAVTFLGPITQRPSVSLEGFLFVGGLLMLFVLASAFGSASLHGAPRVPIVWATDLPTAKRRDRLLRVLLLIGCAGGLLGLYSKLSAADSLSLIASAALRAERAQQLLDAGQITSGPAGAVAFLTYPAGFVATLITVLRYEQCRTSTRMLALFYLPVVFMQSIAAGGRSPILVLIIFVGLASYLRRWYGQSAIPRSRPLRLLVVALVTAFFAYSSVIWLVRSELADMNTDAFLAHADETWGVTPSRGLQAAAEVLGAPNLVQSVMSSVFYFTGALAVTERILAMNASPLLLGGYQVDLVAGAMRVIPGGNEFLARGYDILLEADIYGYFAGAWGSLYIDFGIPGSVLAAILWGVLAGRSQLALRRAPQGDGAALYAFWIYSVFISFVSPPLGFSNSALTFAWVLVFHLAMKPGLRLRAPRRASTAT